MTRLKIQILGTVVLAVAIILRACARYYFRVR
jgi:hypothetical protein